MALAVGVISVAYGIHRAVQRASEYNPDEWVVNHARRAWK
jgi:hypothetical protein